MTPEEYVRDRAIIKNKITEWQGYLDSIRTDAERCPMPASLRPALPEDVVPGAILWYDDFDENVGRCWNLVVSVDGTLTGIKGYIAEDGSRYGVEGAYVEVKP